MNRHRPEKPTPRSVKSAALTLAATVVIGSGCATESNRIHVNNEDLSASFFTVMVAEMENPRYASHSGSGPRPVVIVAGDSLGQTLYDYHLISGYAYASRQRAQESEGEAVTRASER